MTTVNAQCRTQYTIAAKNAAEKLEKFLAKAENTYSTQKLENMYFSIASKAFDGIENWENLDKKEQNSYRNGFVNMGNYFVKHLDEKYGNGDGQLTRAEFVKYRQKSVYGDMSGMSAREIENANKPFVNTFNNINVEGGKTISIKEMATFLATIDGDIDEDKDGEINGQDYTRHGYGFVEKGTQLAKQFKQQMIMVYEELFGVYPKSSK